jgi:hypothetical protein
MSGDGPVTTKDRTKKRNANAARKARQRHKIHTQSQQLLIDALKCTLQTLTESVTDAARNADPRPALDALMQRLPDIGDLRNVLARDPMKMQPS